MRFQQKQRKNNKTARQIFEHNRNYLQKRRRECLLRCLQQLKENHKQFVGKDMDTNHITFDRQLDWKEFLNIHNKMFINQMSKLQTPKSADEFVRWTGVIGTMKAAVKITNDVGADNRYQAFLQVLNNSLRSW